MGDPLAIMFEGSHSEPSLPRCLITCDSMDLSNDPRFFQPNVLNRRLKAFHALTIVSMIMAATALRQCFTTRKNMNFSHFSGWVHASSFGIMTGVLFLDVFSLFVLVHQLFYSYRLMTAGPSGFEVAASFYLHPAISQYRKLAVRMLLQSMSLFLFGCGLHISFLFYRDATVAAVPGPGDTVILDPNVHMVFASVVFGSWLVMACFLIHVHRKHRNIFRERYALVMDCQIPLLRHVKMLGTRTNAGHLSA